MKLSRIKLIFLLLLPLHSIYAGADTQPFVTVIYEITSAGTQAPKIEAIQWESGLDLGKAIATAGGFSRPPFREIYLIRDGTTTHIQRESILEGGTPIPLLPGDTIKLK
jgi:protein involved in polysaccharide export with SLBB domain